MVASAFAGSVVIFILLRMVGGDIATVMLGTRATPESLAILRESFGLNRSWPEQYVSWIGGPSQEDVE
jgi:peptide/nickel transport system permease protein